MASLLVSAAINIGTSLLLNFLFPQKGQDITQEGPRLGDLTVTSSAYGQMVNIGYGTDRMGGNIIWSPGIEEVATTEVQEAGGGKGGGGGGSVTTTTYSYFASFAISFSEGVAADVLRIWGDGKLIYDKTGSGLATDRGLRFRFYPGNETQLPDPLIEADKGAGNVPAFRGLCYLVAERWALADFGNRIPQITAEIAYLATNTMPFQGLTELPGLNIPGSSSGADEDSHMYLDPFTDNLYFLKEGTTGVSRQSVGSMSTQAIFDGGGGLSGQNMWYCMNDKIYGQFGGGNFVGFTEVEPNSMRATGVKIGGDVSLGTWGDPFEYPNGSFFGVLRVGAPEAGVDYVDFFVISAHSILGDGGFVIVYPGVGGTLTQDNYITGYDIGTGGPVMQDFHNRRLFLTQESTTQVDLYEVTASINVGLLGPEIDRPTPVLLGSFTKGGVDYTGTADTTGWCFLPDEEAVILSNGVSMFKVDLGSGAVLARNLALGFSSQDQYSNNGKLAFGNGFVGAGDGGLVYTIDTDDLTVLTQQDLGDAGFSDALESNYERGAYDPRSHSLIISRQNASTASAGIRVVRILLERANGLGVGLDTVVADLCQRSGLVTS